ncbi:benzoate/H(+) symporter BenE family transporter [Pseudovibrio exalbescens]|uniref:benzoate/H(+) symporter BenE family transporter n=1 Tax=Pseudovibrio exalbescens TaxID=197461 RepID=UPI0023670BF7|nr:benzoate/H(+) symporter BenE family transporter [Pseudovibrio exalbescens]MDD7910896.1 benzoate/H(+) symporter BenE family transporter [Pseudovibrio exalbescens]
MFKSISSTAVFAGFLAAFVGFASSFAVIIQGLRQVGATPEQAASGLMVLSILMGGLAILLSLKTKMPISIAWSTPGAALLASSVPLEGGFALATGAFVVAGLLVVVTAYFRPLERLISAIPTSIAQAMLAGVLMVLCLAPVKAVASLPLVALPIVLTWLIVGRMNRIAAVPAAVVATAIAISLTTDLSGMATATLVATPILVFPEFSWAALVGIAVPLYIVTMASQNIPGMAILNSFGYKPRSGPTIGATGIATMIGGPFGALSVNMAAITAAMCAGEEVHPDPARRYWSAVFGGVLYIFLGIFAAAAVAFISLSPPILIEAVAGLALIGALTASMSGALKDTENREAAMVTFLIATSGVSALGIGSAFWALLFGCAMVALNRVRHRNPA